jgi:PST family polysaccharide transporter
LDEAPDLTPMAGRAVRASAWMVVARWAKFASVLVLYLVLARVLSPGQFATIAFAGLAVGLLHVLVDGGLGDTIVRLPRLAPGHVAASRLANAGVGALAGVALYVAAPALAQAFSLPEGGPLLRLMAPVPLLTGLGQTRGALLRRDLRFRALALRQAAAVVLASAVGVAMVLSGAAVTSIAGYHLTLAGSTFLLLLTARERRPWAWPTATEVQEVVAFGGKSAGISVAYQMRGMAPGFLAGLLIGPAALGQFGLAQRIAGSVQESARNPLVDASFPFLARLQSDRLRLQRAWLKGTTILAAVLSPVFVGLALVAQDAVRMFAGPGWENAAFLLACYSLAVAIQLPAALTEATMKATGRAGRFLAILVAFLALDLALYAWFLQAGIPGLGAALLLRAILTTPVLVWVGGEARGPAAREFVAVLARVVGCTVAMAAGVLLVGDLLAGRSAVVRLAALVPVGAVVYGVAVRAAFPALSREALAWLKGAVSPVASASGESRP